MVSRVKGQVLSPCPLCSSSASGFMQLLGNRECDNLIANNELPTILQSSEQGQKLGVFARQSAHTQNI